MQNRIQMEIVAMMLDTNLVEQRQRRLEQELNNYFMELQEMLREAQQNDARNIEYILESTTTK
jgi:parvulin-like peptidyl-prolyl isomerase